MKAVIMCGGKGSRLKPLTENTPKPLVKILNRPVLDIIIGRLTDVGIKEIYLSLGYMGNDIATHCERLDIDADITYCYEESPLGTAGGVRNCINATDDDILILSGDNIFDIDLKKLIDFHYDSNSDFTVCGIEVDDPREYGVITCDEDCSIKCFIEKPTWEQAEGETVNTGIYVMNGSILKKIPLGKKFDFSDDLFPEIFRSTLRFMCYKAKGFWGDMGSFSAYRNIVRSILKMGCNGFEYRGRLYENDEVLENGGIIKAPCIIGEKTKLEPDSITGPFCVIGDNCTIGTGTVVENATIGNNCNVGSDCELKGCFVDDNAVIKDNCSVEKDCVIGFSSILGRFSRVLSGKKIWIGRKVADETIVSKDMLFETPERISFDVFGITAKANSQFSLSDAVMLGQAIASCEGINRVGVGSDNDYVSENFRSALLCGLRACKATAYDFGEMFRTQAYFYSAYCALDFFIFVGASGDVISLSFFGKNGLPVSASQSRAINNNYKFSAFSFSEPGQYTEIFNMKLFSMVYKSFYKKLCPLPLNKINVSVETDNTVMKELAEELFGKVNHTPNNKAVNIQLLFNSSGSELFVVENGKVYSGERILALMCELECADGNNVLVGEEAPDCLEINTVSYSGNIFRIYESSILAENFSERLILSSVWTNDMFLLAAKLLNVMNNADISLSSLFECHKSFAVRKSILEMSDDVHNLSKIFNACGAKKSSDNVYYVFDGKIGRVRMRQLGNSRKIRLLAEADDMEAAKEISVFISQKIKNHIVDKNK